MQVPLATHLTWRDLVTGKTDVKPSFLAARLMLVRARLESNSNPACVGKLAAELREVFAQNPSSPAVQHDLKMIFG